MGNFRVVIESVGGHGCDRKAKAGEEIHYYTTDADFEHRQHCPDCMFKAIVNRLKNGWPDTKATLTHWPGEPSEVVDDLAAGKRVSGSF